MKSDILSVKLILILLLLLKSKIKRCSTWRTLVTLSKSTNTWSNVLPTWIARAATEALLQVSSVPTLPSANESRGTDSSSRYLNSWRLLGTKTLLTTSSKCSSITWAQPGSCSRDSKSSTSSIKNSSRKYSPINYQNTSFRTKIDRKCSIMTKRNRSVSRDWPSSKTTWTISPRFP